MAAAAAPPGPPANFLQYLQQEIRVPRAGMRAKIDGSGFEVDLYNKDDSFTHSVCQQIRKTPTGLAQDRDITSLQEDRLRQFARYVKYCYIVQRQVVYADASLARLRHVDQWFKTLPEDPSDDMVATYKPGIDRRLWVDSIIDYFRAKKGAHSKVPLLYVLREVVALPAVDPGFGIPDLDQEVERRGRHDGDFFNSDNRSVWGFLAIKCRGTDTWTTIEGFARRQDGRQAFLALVRAFMGANVRRELLKNAELTLSRITFDNRSRNWTYQKFIGKLRQAFSDLGEPQPTEEGKVIKLLQAWNVGPLMHLPAIVSTNFPNDFEGAVTFLSDQLTDLKTKNDPKTRTIAAVDTSRGGPKNPGGKGKGKGPNGVKPKAKFDKKNPGNYVSREAWKKMSEEERKQAREARQQKGIAVRNVSTLATKSETAAQVQEEAPQKPPAEPQMVNLIPGQRQIAAQLKLPPPPPPQRLVQFATTRRLATYNPASPANPNA